MIVIEKNIPMPTRGAPVIRQELYDAFEKMEKTDSFLVESSTELNRVRTYASRRKIKIHASKENGKFRIWKG